MTFLLPQLVDRAAERDAERDAYRVPGHGLSYGELARRSDRLAALLADEGVGRRDRVGVFMPRCLESPLAVYGILKAGAAFVPLDPHLPVDALRRLIVDCDIRCLVAHAGAARGLGKTLIKLLQSGDFGGLRTVVGIEISEDFGAVRNRPWQDLEAYDRPPDVRMLGEDLAYIMYSSGSTGRPKGIQHSHRSGLSYARLSVDTYGVTADDRIGNHSPLHFDMSTFGYFSAPLAGATTVLIPEAYTKLTASLSQLMEKERLSIWYSVPLALIQLLDRGVLDDRDLGSLRWILFGGEPFSKKHLYRLMDAWPGARFSNVYGPAEVNQCTYFHVPRPLDPAAAAEDPERNGSPVPIGRIWPDTESRVLDSDDRPVADGEVGELVVRSSTMMLGYWGRPDLNARAFYREETAGGTPDVFYRTGDLVRRDDDGELVFLGRKDRQVKIRGYRLELDDIERTLTAHGSVREAAVFPVRIDGEVRHLEAVVQAPAGTTTADPEVLGEFLARRLSWYAVPAKIRSTPEFPRTTSGKINRRALQEQAEHAAATPRVSTAEEHSPNAVDHHPKGS